MLRKLLKHNLKNTWVILKGKICYTTVAKNLCLCGNQTSLDTNVILACNQSSQGTISHQCIFTTFYEHIKLYTKNDLTMHWRKMVLGENLSHASIWHWYPNWPESQGCKVRILIWSIIISPIPHILKIIWGGRNVTIKPVLVCQIASVGRAPD